MTRTFLTNLFASVFLAGIFAVPVFLAAQSIPVPSDEDVEKPGYLIVCDGPDCGFDDLMRLVKRAINFMVLLSTLIATAAFAYAGFLLLTSRGDTNALKKSKDIFWKVMWGFIWVLVAWLLIYTILGALVGDKYSLLGNP